jgi:Zn-dependent peptidase ImmA (M78 family)
VTKASDVKRGEDAALALRQRLELGNQPIDNIWDLIREQGVKLAFHDFGEEAGDGLYEWDGEWALVVINESRPAARQRFTAAHELGHHEMHREDSAVLIADKNVAAARSPRERQANAFAGSFLAPTRALQRDVAELNHRPEPEDVVRLMRKYGLSYAATVYRLHNAGCISAKQRNHLQAAGAGQVNWLMQVLDYSEDDVFPRGSELPPDFLLNVAQMYRQGAITDDRLAELLRSAKSEALSRVSMDASEGVEQPEDSDKERIRELLAEA